MDVFTLRNNIIGDYSTYIRSFIEIRDEVLIGYLSGGLIGLIAYRGRTKISSLDGY